MLIIDDTVEEKPYTETIVRDLSSESELVCWHYDHSQGRSVKGINIVNILYEAGGVQVPVGFETVEKTLQVWDKKKGKWQKKERGQQERAGQNDARSVHGQRYQVQLCFGRHLVCCCRDDGVDSFGT